MGCGKENIEFPRCVGRECVALRAMEVWELKILFSSKMPL